MHILTHIYAYFVHFWNLFVQTRGEKLNNNIEIVIKYTNNKMIKRQLAKQQIMNSH